MLFCFTSTLMCLWSYWSPSVPHWPPPTCSSQKGNKHMCKNPTEGTRVRRRNGLYSPRLLACIPYLTSPRLPSHPAYRLHSADSPKTCGSQSQREERALTERSDGHSGWHAVDKQTGETLRINPGVESLSHLCPGRIIFPSESQSIWRGGVRWRKTSLLSVEIIRWRKWIK